MGYFSMPADQNDHIELVKCAMSNLKLFLETADPKNDPYLYLLPIAILNIRKAQDIITANIKEKLNEDSTNN